MINRKVSILGCGWLGLPLAKDLIEKGCVVKGSTTTATKEELLEKEGIKAYVFTLGKEQDESIISEFLKDSEVVIINFPPKRIPDITTIYQEQINSVLPFIEANQKVIFVSSTSVYQNTNDWVTEAIEAKPEKESGIAVLAVEDILREELKERVTIVRFSGLIGYDRLPGRFLANKKEVANGKAPINVIHQEDCIRLLEAIIEQNCWGEIINGSTDEHPLREAYYTRAAEIIGLTPPTFKHMETVAFKKISNIKGKKLLSFRYKHPDPLQLLENNY